MPSQMKREYAAVPKGGNINRSSFDLSQRHLTSHHGGHLVPIFWGWAFPGEVLRAKFDAFVRMSSPLEFPLFDNMKLTIHSYFTPLRQVWTNARKFLGEQEDPGDSISYTLPEYGSSTLNTETATLQAHLLRYLGCPIRGTTAGGTVDESDLSAIPVRTYCHVYNWHYRDQQQQDSVDFGTDDGPDDAFHGDYILRTRGKRHDRFTSLLPSPQRGDSVPAVAEVHTALNAGGTPSVYSDAAGGYKVLDSDAAVVDVSATGGGQAGVLHAEMLISELRNAAAIQQFLERDNRYGTRYDEIIYSHYGVEFNDLRIAPTYLGGGSGYIQTSAIPNQSGSSGNLGDLAAIATGVLSGAGFTYAVDEPGIWMVIANVSADLSYSQGLEKKWSYRTRYDLLWPEFARIGDQAVENKEIYYQGTAADDTVFGYEPRYEEFRTAVNRTSGEFDPQDLLSLDVMHLQEELGSAPVLGDTWIKDSSPYARVLQVATQHHFLADYKMSMRVARALPINGVPGLARL